MITLAEDRLSFTFPEIARQLRAHVGRQIGRILPEFLHFAVAFLLAANYLSPTCI